MGKLSIILTLIIITGWIVLPFPVRAQEKPTGYQIMELVDKRPIPVDQSAEMTMNLIDKRGKVRSRTIKTYRMGDEKQVMWFREPADVKGSSFLRLSQAVTR